MPLVLKKSLWRTGQVFICIRHFMESVLYLHKTLKAIPERAHSPTEGAFDFQLLYKVVLFISIAS